MLQLCRLSDNAGSGRHFSENKIDFARQRCSQKGFRLARPERHQRTG